MKSKPMTEIQARAKARDIWGRNARVRKDKAATYRSGAARPTHYVGQAVASPMAMFMVRGSGFSFEEAFAAYQASVDRDHASYVESRRKAGLPVTCSCHGDSAPCIEHVDAAIETLTKLLSEGASAPHMERTREGLKLALSYLGLGKPG